MPKPQLRSRTTDALAFKAKAALAAVEVLTVEVETKTVMTRESWIAYGRALLDARNRMGGDTKKLGAWVRKHQLNVGLAKSPSVRSNALWCAAHAAELQRCKWLTAYHPTAMRRAFLAAAQAGERDHRRSVRGLPEELSKLVWEIADAAKSIAGAVEYGVATEQIFTREDLAGLHEHVQVVVDVLACIDTWAAANPGLLATPGQSVKATVLAYFDTHAGLPVDTDAEAATI